MAALLIIIATIAFLFITHFRKRSSESEIPKTRHISFPAELMNRENDKLIVVNNADYQDITKAIAEFCKMYSKQSSAVQIRLWRRSENSFAVTFPYDTTLDLFCFAVNYLNYPTGINNWKAKVTGWATLRTGDTWVNPDIENKMAMFFISAYDKEYDNVFITTENNISYKLPFGGFTMKAKEQHDQPERLFMSPYLKREDLKNYPSEDFE